MSAFTPFEDKLDGNSIFNGSSLQCNSCLKSREISSHVYGAVELSLVAGFCFSLPDVCVSRLLLSGSSLSFLYLADTVTVTDFRLRVNTRVELNSCVACNHSLSQICWCHLWSPVCPQPTPSSSLEYWGCWTSTYCTYAFMYCICVSVYKI